MLRNGYGRHVSFCFMNGTSLMSRAVNPRSLQRISNPCLTTHKCGLKKRTIRKACQGRSKGRAKGGGACVSRRQIGRHLGKKMIKIVKLNNCIHWFKKRWGGGGVDLIVCHLEYNILKCRNHSKADDNQYIEPWACHVWALPSTPTLAGRRLFSWQPIRSVVCQSFRKGRRRTYRCKKIHTKRSAYKPSVYGSNPWLCGDCLRCSTTHNPFCHVYDNHFFVTWDK